jgi:hypothetical protein
MTQGHRESLLLRCWTLSFLTSSRFIRAHCEHAFVSIKGSPYVNFLRALDRGDILLVRSAAAELPRINLGDALRICMVFRTSPEPGLFERAAVRWLGRFCLEAKDVQLAELEQAHPDEAFAHLTELCEAHGIRLGRRTGD